MSQFSNAQLFLMVFAGCGAIILLWLGIARFLD